MIFTRGIWVMTHTEAPSRPGLMTASAASKARTNCVQITKFELQIPISKSNYPTLSVHRPSNRLGQVPFTPGALFVLPVQHFRACRRLTQQTNASSSCPSATLLPGNCRGILTPRPVLKNPRNLPHPAACCLLVSR